MATFHSDWKGDRYLKFPITRNDNGKCFEELIKPIFDKLAMSKNESPNLPQFVASIPEYGIEKGTFLLKANKKNWITMSHLKKEKSLISFLR